MSLPLADVVPVELEIQPDPDVGLVMMKTERCRWS